MALKVSPWQGMGSLTTQPKQDKQVGIGSQATPSLLGNVAIYEAKRHELLDVPHGQSGYEFDAGDQSLS